MSCAAFLEVCNGNCTDNTAFEKACDTCPPDTCAGFLKLCVGNCTDDSAFDDACMKSCADGNTNWGSILVLLALALAVIWYYKVYKPRKKREKEEEKKKEEQRKQDEGLGRQLRNGYTLVPQVITQGTVLPRGSGNNAVQNFKEEQRSRAQEKSKKYKEYYGRAMSSNEFNKYLMARSSENNDYFIDDDGRLIDASTLTIRPGPYVQIGKIRGFMYPQNELTKEDIRNINLFDVPTFQTHDLFIVRKKDLIIVEDLVEGYRGVTAQPVDRKVPPLPSKPLNQPKVF